MYYIADLSNNNRVLSFSKVRSAGIEGVWLKASEGATMFDADVVRYTRNARSAGLRVGHYHFAYPTGGDAKAEARWFAKSIAAAGGIDRRALRPVLDLEINPVKMSGPALVAWAREFNQELLRLTGTLPIFYSYPYFIMALHASVPIGEGLWLAAYGPNDGKEHPYTVPAPWKKAVAHQFTSRGHLPGVEGWVDISSARSLRPLLAHPVVGKVPVVDRSVGGGGGRPPMAV